MSSYRSKSDKCGGFTLVEVMVVVAIIGILSAAAVPAYQEYIMKNRRADATIALSAIAARQQEWRSMRNAYSGNADPYGDAVTGDGLYTITIASAGDGSDFALIATPASGTSQEQDTDCGNFRIDNLGRKTVSADGYTVGSDLAKQCWSFR